MSNCINNGINKIYVLTQFTSLNRHLARTYNFGNSCNFGDGYVEVLAAAQRLDGQEWFQGTADAVRQYMCLLEDAKNKDVEDVIILSGNHLYRMDYEDFVQEKSVAPFSKWENELPKFLFDPRFKGIPSHIKRPCIYENYVRIRADVEPY